MEARRFSRREPDPLADLTRSLSSCGRSSNLTAARLVSGNALVPGTGRAPTSRRNLLSAASWIRRILAYFFPPEQAALPDPDQVFQDAIVETRQKFLDLRATASPLYRSRDALREQERQRREQIEAAGQRASELIAAGQEKAALKAAAEQGRLEPELEKILQDLAELERPIAQVEAQLVRIEGKVRDLENERHRSQALMKGADARLAVERILSAGLLESGEADLAAAREMLAARLDHARTAEELAASSIQEGMRALEEELSDESARARLEAIREAAALPPADRAALPPGRGEGE